MCTENMCKMKIAAVLMELSSLSALVSDTMFQQAITSVFGQDGPKIMGIVAIIGILSAKLLHWLDAQPPDPPELQEVPDEPVSPEFTTPPTEPSELPPHS